MPAIAEDHVGTGPAFDVIIAVSSDAVEVEHGRLDRKERPTAVAGNFRRADRAEGIVQHPARRSALQQRRATCGRGSGLAVDHGVGGLPCQQFGIGCGTAPGTNAQVLQGVCGTVAIEVQRPVALDHVSAGLTKDHVIASTARNIVIAIGRGDHGGRGKQPNRARRTLRIGLRKCANRGGPRNGPRAHIGRGPDQGTAVSKDYVMTRAAINQVAPIRGCLRAGRAGHC